jgi:hypothetical protein
VTTLILAAKRGALQTREYARALRPWRLALLAMIPLLMLADPKAANIIFTAISDAYLQVTVFVAATLALFYGLESRLKIDATELLARHRAWQVPVAALLGATPGCGGAIIVITQYIRGGISFGGVVAVLTATMGDAAFLLIAQEPLTAAGVISVQFAAGVLFGYLVDLMHGPDFMRVKSADAPVANPVIHDGGAARIMRPLWVALLVPGLIFGAMTAFQVDPNALFGSLAGLEPASWLAFAGALLALGMWGSAVSRDFYACVAAGDTQHRLGAEPAAHRGADRSTVARVVADTNFVTVWVIAAYLIYELGVYYSGVDLKSWFAVWAPIMPLMGVLVGFLPGCGPQIVVTTLYLNGVVPLSTQLGNAISNDGDALFPAIALAPRTAIVATLYSAIPALIVAYLYYWLWE